MPSMQEFHLRPSWRFRRTLNQQNVTIGGWPTPKDVKNADRPDYVYENKDANDKMTDMTSDIYAQLKPVLQKIPAFERIIYRKLRLQDGFAADSQVHNAQ